MLKKPLIIITGPTASGKTATSIELAKRLDTEIISADSMQVYRMCDIGTAKVTVEEMDGIKHHLIDCLDPKEEFNISIFQDLCKNAMEEIYKKGKIPLIVGGTGFYIQAILKDIDFSKDSEGDKNIRERLKAFEKEYGSIALHEQLKEIDRKSYESIPAGNVKRVIRALEYYELTGEKISDHNERESQKESPYDYMYYVIHHDREVLYERIERRIDVMMKDGLVDEVRRLMDYGCKKDMVSMRGLGYKEIIDYLEGLTTYEEAVNILKQSTRHFAKRQLTWFRREDEVIWKNYKDYDNDVNRMTDSIYEEIKQRYELS